MGTGERGCAQTRKFKVSVLCLWFQYTCHNENVWVQQQFEYLSEGMVLPTSLVFSECKNL